MESFHLAVTEIIFNGAKLGIVLTFLVGPVFFAILQTSLERGFWQGVWVALGVSLSDILYVTICYIGLAQVMANSALRTYMAYAGGLLLIGFGFYHLAIKSRQRPADPKDPVLEKKVYKYMLKGFLINGMTPTVLFFWIGAVSLATLDFGYSETDEYSFFFGSVLLTVLTTDILKAYLADKLRRIVTARALSVMNILLGAFLIYFGCRLILQAKGTLIV